MANCTAGERRNEGPGLLVTRRKQQLRATIELFGRTGSDVLFFYALAEH